MCTATGAPLQVFGAAGTGYYEPFRDGDPACMAALVMGMLDWDRAPGSARLGAQACLADVFAVAAAASADPAVAMLDDVAGLLRPGALTARMERVPPYRPRRLSIAGQVVLTADLLAAEGSMATFIAEQLAGLRASPLGRWLGPARPRSPAWPSAWARWCARGESPCSRSTAQPTGGPPTRSRAWSPRTPPRSTRGCTGRRSAATAWPGSASVRRSIRRRSAGLVGTGAGAGLATVLSTTAAGAVGRLADQVRVLVLHRLDDHSLAGQLAWLTGKRLVPAEPGSARSAQSGPAGRDRGARPRTPGAPRLPGAPPARPRRRNRLVARP